jgi:hypothetical protein
MGAMEHESLPYIDEGAVRSLILLFISPPPGSIKLNLSQTGGVTGDHSSVLLRLREAYGM